MTPTDQLTAILSTIEGKTTKDLQSPKEVQEYLIELTGWLAYSGEQQAVAGKEYNKAKKQAYFNLEANFRSTGHKMPRCLRRTL